MSDLFNPDPATPSNGRAAHPQWNSGYGEGGITRAFRWVGPTEVDTAVGWLVRGRERRSCKDAMQAHLETTLPRPKSLLVVVDRRGVLCHSAGVVRKFARRVTACGPATLVA
jgi:hypothetical protein